MCFLCRFSVFESSGGGGRAAVFNGGGGGGGGGSLGALPCLQLHVMNNT